MTPAFLYCMVYNVNSLRFNWSGEDLMSSPASNVINVEVIREKISANIRVQHQHEALHEQARAIIDSPSTSDGQHEAARSAILSATAMLATPTTQTIQAAQENAFELKCQKDIKVGRLAQLLISLISAVLNVIKEDLTKIPSENKLATTDFKQKLSEENEAQQDNPPRPKSS